MDCRIIGEALAAKDHRDRKAAFKWFSQYFRYITRMKFDLD
jgi:hypothetical protein